MKIVWYPGEEYPSIRKGNQLCASDAERMPDGSLVWDIPASQIAINLENSRLVQTRILSEYYFKLESLAQSEGMTIASYLRRIIIKECEKNGELSKLQKPFISPADADCNSRADTD